MIKRNSKIQILRAVAIIAVVLIHTCPSGYYQVFCRPFVNFAVALFIFLSGYLTKIDNQDWPKLYSRRILRVLIPYFIWTIFYTLPSTNLKEYIFNLVTTQACPTFYYIFVYIQFVILTPVLGKLAKSKYHWFGFVIAPISIVLYKYPIIFFDLQPSGYVNILWDVSCLGWFTYYYLGILLGNRIIDLSYKLKSLVLLYLLSLLLQVLEGYILFCCDVPNCGSQIKLSSLLTSSIFLLMAYKYIIAPNQNKQNKILQYIGDHSFGIYIVHILVIQSLLRFVPYYTFLPFVINTIVVLAITIIVVYIGKKLCGLKVSRWVGLA